MASKVLVPTAPFAKLQIKKSPPESTSSGFIIGGDPAARVAHLEHSVRFLQEQHRLMLSGLHAEIEALRERNRDLQFQLIFNKESSPKIVTPPAEETTESNEAKLKREVSRLEKEAAEARAEAKAAEARALQLQKLVDAQAEKLRVSGAIAASGEGGEGADGAGSESRGALRARLAEAERLVRRLRSEAERARGEVPRAGAGVTNLLFDGHAHLQCMKNSLHASLRASGLDAYGYQNNFHFPPVHTPDFWREPIRDEYANVGRGRARRPLTLPELTPHRAPHNHNRTRSRGNGYEKNKKPQTTNGETSTSKSPEETTDRRQNFDHTTKQSKLHSNATYPELKMVVTKLLSLSQANGADAGMRRPRRPSRRTDLT